MVLLSGGTKHIAERRVLNFHSRSVSDVPNLWSASMRVRIAICSR